MKGVYFLTQALLPLIATGGRIVNFSTGLTRFSAPGFSAYAAAKGAIEVLTRYMARNSGARGIAVNTVARGDRDRFRRWRGARQSRSQHPICGADSAWRRVGLPDDIGPMVASLLSEDNRWVNAQRIGVSGGQAI